MCRPCLLFCLEFVSCIWLEKPIGCSIYAVYVIRVLHRYNLHILQRKTSCVVPFPWWSRQNFGSLSNARLSRRVLYFQRSYISRCINHVRTCTTHVITSIYYLIAVHTLKWNVISNFYDMLVIMLKKRDQARNQFMRITEIKIDNLLLKMK